MLQSCYSQRRQHFARFYVIQKRMDLKHLISERLGAVYGMMLCTPRVWFTIIWRKILQSFLDLWWRDSNIWYSGQILFLTEQLLWVWYFCARNTGGAAIETNGNAAGGVARREPNASLNLRIVTRQVTCTLCLKWKSLVQYLGLVLIIYYDMLQAMVLVSALLLVYWARKLVSTQAPIIHLNGLLVLILASRTPIYQLCPAIQSPRPLHLICIKEIIGTLS